MTCRPYNVGGYGCSTYARRALLPLEARPAIDESLRERIVEACRERGHALLTGEPGVGKTCLLRAVRRRLPETGFQRGADRKDKGPLARSRLEPLDQQTTVLCEVDA